MQKPNILAISGSANSGSSSWQLLKFIGEKYEDSVHLDFYEGLAGLPHFNPVQSDTDVPAEVKKLREQIAKADGILFCTPEYVFSLPGSLKNLIEWNVSTTLFSAKPVAIIVAAASGEKAFESLALILTTIEALLPDESKLLVQGVKGKIKNYEVHHTPTLEKIDELMTSFIQSMRQTVKKPTKYED
ncbi:MAG: NADPH-dependent FMN reductase [Cyclobacteriaceae bacterium]